MRKKTVATAKARAKAGNPSADNDNVISALAITRPLTLGERVALAAASLAIQRLPSVLQQASDAYDMQEMLINPSSCSRGAYILAKAWSIFNSFCGWGPDAIGDGSNLHPEHRAAFEAFVEEAMTAHARDDLYAA
ncbi:hypothetical protein L6654_24145 [Bradyrhizobium sp. WYCCWR 13023]|uniref:Uncharacterized protein n=1 Tax=Bradyrhizobium zhengyangense TaxID=2911009 RepID=A0A9X1RBG6_9BRAD|nr:hypothetical protein [Bradyrhizobium zhengyangense]MCG2629719.1 hypothetical protein [Bradyrhizobium zhengyangense]